MSYRNKTYVCFDADTDIKYYHLMTAWKENDNIDFDFHNAHDLNNLMPYSNEETIKDKLRERMNNSKNFIILVGENTKNLHKFVRWETEIALKQELPIIVVNLNRKKKIDNNLCPAILREELAIHIPFGQKIIKYSLDYWPELNDKHKQEGDTGVYSWKDHVYEELGI